MSHLKTRPVEITARDNGEKLAADLLVCPECGGYTFVAYFPVGIRHLHFQCLGCDVTFCDGCTDASPAAGSDVSLAAAGDASKECTCGEDGGEPSLPHKSTCPKHGE